MRTLTIYPKRFYNFLLLVLILSGFTREVKAQLVPVPDAGFRNFLYAQGFNSCFVGNSIDSTCTLVRNCTQIEIPESYNIYSLDGIIAFKNLNTLRVDSNYITVLPALPDSLKSLICHIDGLTTITSFPPTLEEFSVASLYLTSIPPFPQTITSLDLGAIQISFIPAFPPNLTSLGISGLLLSPLPALPSKIITLWIGSTLLPVLPNIPPLIENLYINSIGLTSLPVLPSSLKSLSCAFNNLTSLPDFPDSLNYLDISYNKGLTCMPEVHFIDMFYFDSTNIHCLPNIEIGSFSSPSTLTIPACDVSNPDGCATYGNILGKVFFDNNSNCTIGSIDHGISKCKIKVFENATLIRQSYSGLYGNFSIDTDHNGTYSTEIDTIGLPFIVSCPSSHSYTDIITNADSIKYNRDFALTCKPDVDLILNNIYCDSPVQGRPVEVRVNAGTTSGLYGVNCGSGISATVEVILDSNLTYVAPAVGALTPVINGNSLIYTIADISTVSSFDAFNFIALVDSNAIMGTVLTIQANINSSTVDNPLNNSFTIFLIVRSSYDPNDKSVSPLDDLYLFGDRWLTYTVRFQNTGNASADRVIIVDTLDANVDLGSFELLANSHPVTLEISQDGICKFYFRNINLPDSTSDEANSHGYVQYRIKAKANLGAGTSISNTANIYFDFNSAVVTNTVVNHITTTVGIQENKKSIINIYPNPANDVFKISGLDVSSLLTIYDLYGKIILQKNVNNNELVPVSHLVTGVYFINFKNSNNSFTFKLIKE